MSTSSIKISESGFLLKWIVIVSLTTMAGVFLAFFGMWTVGGALEASFGEIAGWAAAGAVFGGLIGLGLSSGQAYVLRGTGIPTTPWILAGTLAGALGTAASLALAGLVTNMESMADWQSAIMIGLTLGVNIGVGQWLVLRNHLPNAAVWIPINIVTFLAAAGVALSLDGEGREWLAFGLMAIIAAAGTGLGMKWLLERKQPSLAAHMVVLLMLGLLLAGCQSAAADATAASTGDPTVRFSQPADGATVASPVAVQMTAENFTIEPAGVIEDGVGHFHIMIDTPCIAVGDPIPMDQTHRHFGDASTTAELELSPGSHTLCLQAGNGVHIALPDAGLTHTITVNVQ